MEELTIVEEQKLNTLLSEHKWYSQRFELTMAQLTNAEKVHEEVSSTLKQTAFSIRDTLIKEGHNYGDRVFVMFEGDLYSIVLYRDNPSIEKKDFYHV